ncbi:MAG: DUF6443 domain-containing protein [Prevotellaceae bacterium]|jgi:RHS repeat-associated protein|nr:DUF6443 domain-containing protein [Prevotellaceae bacterium]
MKKYFITLILSILFCENLFSQNIMFTLPSYIGITYGANMSMTTACAGGYYTFPCIEIIGNYSLNVIKNDINSRIGSYGCTDFILVTDVTYSTITIRVLEYTGDDTGYRTVTIEGGMLPVQQGGGYIQIGQSRCFAITPYNPITGDATNANWIMKATYTEPNAAQYYRDIMYYDGLGYPEQVIQIKGSPMQNNIVTPVYYDNMRRDNAKVYLPYVSSNSTAAIENSAFSKQTEFYQNMFDADNGTFAYVENVFEPSPLNRIMQTYSVGAVYRDEDKKSVNSYSTNAVGEVFLMNINQANGNVTVADCYAPKTLYKNSTTNEDGATVITFTDKLGQTILTRTKGDNDQNFDTYYVYDDYGQPVMVITPEYSSSITVSTTLIPGSATVARYCYTYRYDGRKNMIERQMPGKEAEYMIYDKDGRLALYQDGNMRANNQWTYSVYDNVGNLTDKTLVKTNLTRQQIQAKYFASTFHNDYTSLGESRSIYVPFGGDGFTEEYLVESARYYGKSYYVRNNLAPGTYMRHNQSLTVASMNDSEEYDETVSSVDIQAIKKPILIIPIDPIVPILPIGFDCFTCDTNHLYTVGSEGKVKKGDIRIKEIYLRYTDPNNPNIKYYYIPAGYMSIAECLDACSPAFGIYEGIPGGIQTAVWKNPSNLAFEPVAGVCTLADLDTVKVRHLKAYEIVKILADSAAGFVERAFYYDSKSRIIQTVERNHLGYISRYSSKYDFVGNILAQHESHKTGSSAPDTKLTAFTYDQRGRLLTEATTVNDSDTAKVSYRYNELGQQTAKIYGDNLIADSVKYNIQGWVTKKQATNADGDNVFNMRLSYYNPARPNTAPSYTGNITECTWAFEEFMPTTYTFAYDRLNRFTGNSLYYVMDDTPYNYFTENGIEYDKNGNIKNLVRYGAASDAPVALTYSYDGNKLTNIAGTQNAGYEYDTNGNMTFDSRKCINMQYNLFNLPYKITSCDLGTVKANYKYIADGTKVGVVGDDSKGFDYLGSLVYTNNNNTRTLESTGFGGGRIKKTSNSYEIDYYITDHLGSTRVVAGGYGNYGGIKEVVNYYPFGKVWNLDYYPAAQTRYLFSGKEKQITGDINYMDYGNRMYDDFLGRWLVPDLLAEKYYSISPYVYCMNNPLRFIDPNGMDVWEINQQGQVKWIEESKTHVLYALDNKGKRTENSITVNDRGILDQLTTNRNSQFNYAEVGKEGVNDVFNVFKFAADNTSVEWVVHKYENDGTKYTIGTQHHDAKAGSWSDYGIPNQPAATLHSHPGNRTDIPVEMESMGFIKRDNKPKSIWKDSDWYNVQQDVVSNGRQTRLNYVYFPNSNRLYHVNFSGPAFIRKIKNYKQFFFGTLK